MELHNGGRPSHLMCLLTACSSCLSRLTGISLTISGQTSFGSRPCWLFQVLNFPGSSDLSILRRPSSSCCRSLPLPLLSVREESNHLPKHLIGLSISDGISSTWMDILNCLVTFPFFTTRHRDFFGLNTILVHVTVSSRVFRIHRACMWDSVVMVRSYMNPLFAGRRILAFVCGLLVSSYAALRIRFIPITKRITEIKQPVTMPFSSDIHDVV